MLVSSVLVAMYAGSTPCRPGFDYGTAHGWPPDVARGYAEGEHEPRRIAGRNTPAYGIVVPITYQSMIDVGHHG
jgi:hypothetical protein